MRKHDCGPGSGEDAGGDAQRRAWIAAVTQVQAPPLVPELRFAGLPYEDTFETFRTRHAARVGASPPYWAVAWPGGQALARYILDNPDSVRGRRVLDFGCGAGLCASAAAQSGAALAIAADNDPMALCAARVCAALNGVRVETVLADFAQIAGPADLICAGDLWYDRATGRRATAALTDLLTPANRILIGDALRPGRPRTGVVERARYRLGVPAEFTRLGQEFATVSELCRRS